jgi:hypothetical protein
MGKTTFIRMNLSDVRMIMEIIHVLVEELLCQTMTEQIPVVESLLSGVHGACGYVMSYQALNATAS